MNLITLLLNTAKKAGKNPVKGIDAKQEALVKVGREQFKKLLDKGLSVPVVFL